MSLRTLLLSAVTLGAILAQSQAQTLDRFQVGTATGTANANSWPAAESPDKATDGITSSKYLNFGELNTGYIFTLSSGTVVANGLSLTTANDAPERDPLTVSIYGSNAPTAAANTTPGTTYNLSLFTPIVLNLATGLATDPGRTTAAPLLTFTNTTAYSTYLVVFPTVRNAAAANSMQIAEARLTSGGATGTPISNAGTIAGGQLIPEPSSLALLSASVGLLALRRRR